MSKKLAIITTHPIQYYAPVFKLLAQKVALKVFYTWGEDSLIKFDPGFGKKIEWDLPLLEGYHYEFIKNTSHRPGSNHFKGIINPDAIQKIKEYAPDAILIYGWAYHSHLKILRHFKGIISIWFRGDSHMLNEHKGIKKYLRRIFLIWVYSHVDKVFYVGTENKKYFKVLGLKEIQLVFAPHAIDNVRFEMQRADEVKGIKAKLNISEEDILILFAGKFEKVKNPLLLLDAFLDAKIPQTHLLLVGNGPIENELKKKATGHPNIHFLDFQNQQNMPSIYQVCDIFCLPSASETWGLAVNEAMATGKAILVSDKVGCSTDLVVSEKNGEVFKSNSIVDLIKKLKKLCRSKSNLLNYGSYSKKIINDWSFEVQVNVITRELNNL